jgi:regulator of replication initiation timing
VGHPLGEESGVPESRIATTRSSDNLARYLEKLKGGISLPLILRRIGSFIKVLFRHWWFLLLLILSFGSKVATYLPAYLPHFQIPRLLPLAIVILAFIVATFQVFCDQVDAQDELDNKLSVLRNEAIINEVNIKSNTKDLEALRKEAVALREENTRLRINPFDEQRLRLARKLVSELTWNERDLVRFLLLNGDSRIDVISQAATAGYGVINGGLLCQNPVNKGILTRVDDYTTGYATISVKPTWREILPSVLLPRDEERNPPSFDGIA